MEAWGWVKTWTLSSCSFWWHGYFESESPPFRWRKSSILLVGNPQSPWRECQLQSCRSIRSALYLSSSCESESSWALIESRSLASKASIANTLQVMCFCPGMTEQSRSRVIQASNPLFSHEGPNTKPSAMTPAATKTSKMPDPFKPLEYSVDEWHIDVERSRERYDFVESLQDGHQQLLRKAFLSLWLALQVYTSHQINRLIKWVGVCRMKLLDFPLVLTCWLKPWKPWHSLFFWFRSHLVILALGQCKDYTASSLPVCIESAWIS